METTYMQQDFYTMQMLLDEAKQLIGNRTTLLTREDIKKLLDSRKVLINKKSKEWKS